MAAKDEETRRGFLYYWANDPRVEEKTLTVMVVPCEVYSRIVGYMRPVRNWNKGKKQEFAERQEYDVSEAATLKLSPGAKQSADFRDMRDPCGIYIDDVPEVIK